MELLNYALTALVANAGIVIGIILAYIAEEEIEDSRIYFIIMKNIIIGMILAAVLWMFTSSIIITAIVSAFVFALLFWLDFFLLDYKVEGFWIKAKKSRIDKEKKNKEKKRKRAINECAVRITTYALLGAAFYLSSKNIAYFIMVSSLAFIYGFPVGSLALDSKKANKLKIILTSSSFFVIAMLLYIISWGFSG